MDAPQAQGELGRVAAPFLPLLDRLLAPPPLPRCAVMAAVGDALALELMERKGVTREEYGLRHHGGYLGKRARTDNLPE